MLAPKLPLKEYTSLLHRYIKPHRSLVVILAVLLFSKIALQLINPQVMRRFIDMAQTGGALILLLRGALLYTAFAIFQQIVAILATYIGTNVAWKATNELRVDLASHCLRLDMSFHNKRSPGEMIERVDGDIIVLANFFSQFVIEVVGNALLLIGVLGLLFATDWRVGVPMTAFMAIALIIMLRLQGFGASLWEARRQSIANLYGFLEERLSGVEDIKSCGAKAYVMRGFFRLCRDLLHKTMRAGTIGGGITTNTSGVLFAVGSATALAIGIYLFKAEGASLGTVYIIYHYSAMLMGPIRRLAGQMRDLQQAGAGISRVRELFQTRTKIEDAACHISIPDEKAFQVVFNGVSFSYKSSTEEEPVLQNLSFSLRAGGVLGLLGRTGSGKTTLGRLLFRLYDVNSGSICLGREDGLTNIKDVPLQELRKRIGWVTQNIQLFRASVRDNITFFDDRIDDERIMEIIRDLGLMDWYASLPGGLESDLAADSLSAGEAQLLAFARVFLKNPGLVILDEATSRLDPATERWIERAFAKLIKGRTAIIIAHRLKTVERADEIMILEGGKILEHGGRNQLSSNPKSQYSRLVRGVEGGRLAEVLV
jgi:ATP-binding cassette subfamily B protein